MPISVSCRHLSALGGLLLCLAGSDASAHTPPGRQADPGPAAQAGHDATDPRAADGHQAHSGHAERDHRDHHDHATDLSTVRVQSTRSGRRVSEVPIRVDVVPREEIEEKLLMSPGDVTMLVAETAGVRVQNTAPGMGGSGIRIQGLRGRYTQLLADGLPLYGGQSSSIGLLQIPPTDLGSVEIIKGSASALYGPAALGGVVNLISRRPREVRDAELLLNTTSRGGHDATAYMAGALTPDWGLSLTTGWHRQSRQDIDGDGWVDMPGYTRTTLRPRLFWSSETGARALVSAGATREDRQGGTLPGRALADGTTFALQRRTERVDAGTVIEVPVRQTDRVHVRASAMSTEHQHRYGESLQDDRHQTGFAELAYAGGADATTWVAGAAVQADRYTTRQFPQFDYRHSVPAVFAQFEQSMTDALVLSGSARWDDHNAYGSHLSPRIAVLYTPGPWTARASIGSGFHAPTPFVEEIEAAGLARLAPLQALRAETATTAALELGWAEGPWETNLSLFASNVDDAVRLVDIDVAGGPGVQLVNMDGTTRTRGAEWLLRYRRGDFVVTGSYVHVDAREPDVDSGGHRRVPLTPRHSGGVVAMWEQHGRGRVGLEAYYTGTQTLDEDPYRRRGRAYFELGALGEIELGRISLFLNLENLLGVRQTRYAPLVRPARASDGQWTVDAWAPLEGFVVNGGVRLRF